LNPKLFGTLYSREFFRWQ